MSLELQSMKNLLSIEMEALLTSSWPNDYHYQLTAICRKAQCRGCAITFQTEKKLSLSAVADMLVEPFSSLCVGLAKVAQEEKDTSGKRKAKYVASNPDDDVEINWEDWR